MICPSCGKNTSDMMSTCEWCGALTLSDKAYEAPPDPFIHSASGIEGGKDSGKVSLNRYASTKSAGGNKPFYLKTWPYALAVLIGIILVASLFLFRGKTKSPVTRSELLVSGLPTVLDFYTDT